MSWDDRVIDDAEPGFFQPSDRPGSLRSRVEALLDNQKRMWPFLREGYVSLSQVEVKSIAVDGSEVLVQHNPRRIRSTAARVDKESVEARGCFLCAENLPREEKGISYSSDLVILCNPLPVLDRHLSIVRRDHVSQRIDGSVETLLALAYDLAPDYFVLYNGPECGASAPDHLHFQACARSLLPIENSLRAVDAPAAERCEICESTPRDEFELFTLADCGRTAVVFRGNDPDRLARWVYEVVSELGGGPSRPEPMMNLIVTHDDRQWTVFLFPRARHRPACFFAEGGDRLTVSPGAIDMAGVLVVPEKEHFNRLNADLIQQIYSEVSLPEGLVNEVVERVCARSGIEEAV